MNIATITEVITTLGFPIACVIALGIFVWKIYKRSEEREDKLIEGNREREDKLMVEIGETRAINAKAIETIAHYSEKLEIIQEDVKEIKTAILIHKE